MENLLGIVQQQAEEALGKLDAQGIVSAEYVAESVIHQSAYWEKTIASGEKLLFVRFFSPIVQREEVFLGNILFNAFLSKALARAVADSKSGKAELVANDLQNYYFLLRTTADLAVLVEAFRAEVERSLPDLFFGEPNETQSVYGEFSGMFSFRKSDFEPFPVYAVPEYLAPQLGKAVRRVLTKLLIPPVFPTRVRTVLAAIAFFYGRKSGGSGDAQSFPNFVDHLVNDKDYDRVLKAADVKKAFNIRIARKPEIKESLDSETYSAEALRTLITGLVHAFDKSIDAGSTKWFMGALRKDDKFPALPIQDYLHDILASVQVGVHATAAKRHIVAPPNTVRCTVCGALPSKVSSSMVVMGVRAFDRHNQSTRQPQKELPRVCTRCGLFSYLGQKLLGALPRSIGGTPPKLPMVPKTYNLIFHYGKHNDAEVDALVRKLDLIWDRVRTHQQKEHDVASIRKAVRDLEEQLVKQKNEQKKPGLDAQRQEKRVELGRKESELKEATDALLTACPWLATPSSTYEIPSLDLLTHFQSQGKIERNVLGLGLGGYRMTLFVLPQIRSPRDKEYDFAQSRFSHSRITVTAMLAFLRELCGCDGPFYYQSLPTLTPDAFRRETFYVQNEPISAKRAQDEYEAITQLAWKLIWQRGSDGFVRKVVLAENLLKDPLGTFSAVMRDSKILGQSKGNYKPLPGGWRTDWKAQDLTEYAKFIQRLSRLKEETSSGTQG